MSVCKSSEKVILIILMVICLLFNDNREVIETVTYPSRLDVVPISGVLSFSTDQYSDSLSISSQQDVEAESNEVFSIILITSKGGARISSSDHLAKLTGEPIYINTFSRNT